MLHQLKFIGLFKSGRFYYHQASSKLDSQNRLTVIPRLTLLGIIDHFVKQFQLFFHGSNPVYRLCAGFKQNPTLIFHSYK